MPKAPEQSSVAAVPSDRIPQAMATITQHQPAATNPAIADSAKTLASYGYLHDLMKHYQVKDLVNVDADSFVRTLQELHTPCEATTKSTGDDQTQHPMAARFHWGHRHNFGEFSMPGRMGNHHIAVVATFIDALPALSPSLHGKRVLDIGCWTGGTSLLLAAMGAQVVAIEEIKMYAHCAEFLRHAFDVRNLSVKHKSLYDCIEDEMQDSFDLVLFAGVLHHLSDPKLALRIVFNSLRDGGVCLLETLSFDHDKRILARRAEDAAGNCDGPWGWNWLLFTAPTLTQVLRDVGYEITHPCRIIDGRTYVVAQRKQHVPMRRSGLSVSNIR